MTYNFDDLKERGQLVLSPVCKNCADFSECWRKNFLSWVFPGSLKTFCPGHSDNGEPKKDNL